MREEKEFPKEGRAKSVEVQDRTALYVRIGAMFFYSTYALISYYSSLASSVQNDYITHSSSLFQRQRKGQRLNFARAFYVHNAKNYESIYYALPKRGRLRE